MTIQIDWNNSQPIEAGYYLVAIKLAPSVGYFDMAIWNGQAWECMHPDRIIGHYYFEALKAQFSLSWPAYDLISNRQIDNAKTTQADKTPDSSNHAWEEI